MEGLMRANEVHDYAYICNGNCEECEMLDGGTGRRGDSSRCSETGRIGSLRSPRGRWGDEATGRKNKGKNREFSTTKYTKYMNGKKIF